MAMNPALSSSLFAFAFSLKRYIMRTICYRLILIRNREYPIIFYLRYKMLVLDDPRFKEMLDRLCYFLLAVSTMARNERASEKGFLRTER